MFKKKNYLIMSGVQVSAGACDSSAVVLAQPQQQLLLLLQEVTVTQFSPEAVDGIITSEVVLAPPQQQQQEQIEGMQRACSLGSPRFDGGIDFRLRQKHNGLRLRRHIAGACVCLHYRGKNYRAAQMECIRM
ncbi:hypothetical protein SETIT_6G004800v2 [Setaria italica]|uniref:Uncharacterized protein n=1 Tax=Setaria italica TaxID=4555 RepID=A0A368RGJ7_SETIT|nr:hypothetical protein SETIT_6G004800v2 [Setaria italica]